MAVFRAPAVPALAASDNLVL